MAFASTNPATGESFGVYDEHSNDQIDQTLLAAGRAQADWARSSFEFRADRFVQLSALLEARANDLAVLMATEMGKPVGEGRAEANKCAWVCRYYAEHAERFLRDEAVATDALESFVTYRPLGIVLAIMPWNFPLWQVLRFAAPTLMAGNGAILKHAPNVPGCALAIEELFRDADFPAGLFSNVFLSNDRTEKLIAHRTVAAVTLTGSTRAGRSVASVAGAALKKVVLELGGSDPYIVLADADLAKAAEVCVASRMINSGQSCIAAKRFIIPKHAQTDFERLVVELMDKRTVGDPLAPATDVGPIARADLRDDLHRQVEESVAAGARCLLGGEIPPGAGYFYPPTVLAEVGPEMPAYDEELFGPVASIIPARDEADAIRIANDTSYGLGAAVFSKDVARARQIARDQLSAGSCFVNDFVRSDPRLPFGGIKDSGIGRELGRLGIHEFVNAKTVYVA